jgi:hypothetical protein
MRDKPNKNICWFHSKVIVFLVLLQLVIDMVYVYLYPTINPIRATLIGATALVILFIPWLRKFLNLDPWFSFLPIYSSALFGSLLVLGEIIISKSALSAIVHVIILIVTYAIVVLIKRGKK